jgi:ABC-type glycerol-3-phosphate transport system permease component
MDAVQSRPAAVATTKPVSHKPRFRLGTILLHATLIFFCLIVILPLLWVFLLSFKTLPDAYTGTFWPTSWDFSHYAYVFTAIPGLLVNMGNSIFVTLATVLLVTMCAVPAAYAMTHMRVPGRFLFAGLLVGSLFFPSRLISIIAIFEIQSQLGLINSLPGLVLPYVTLNLAVSIMIMRGMFEQISPEIGDAARIDGANSWKIFWSVMLPLVANGIVVLVIVNFVTAWGEYLLAVTLTNDQSVRTMPVVLASAFGGMGGWAWPRIAAVYMMVITPGIIIFAFAQRWYMKGLLEGALKL